MKKMVLIWMYLSAIVILAMNYSYSKGIEEGCIRMWNEKYQVVDDRTFLERICTSYIRREK